MPWFIAAKAFLGGVPRWVWIALAAVAALTAGVVWHHHKAGEAIKAAVNARDREWQTAIAKMHQHDLVLRQQEEAAAAVISDKVRKQNEEANRTIAADAAAVRLRGPGAASCRPIDYPRVSIGAGRSQPVSGSGDAAVAQVPSGEGIDLIGLPFTGTVSFAQQHDAFRAEALSWRDWYAKQSAAWEKMRAGH
jgi:hypothetical protein